MQASLLVGPVGWLRMDRIRRCGLGHACTNVHDHVGSMFLHAWCFLHVQEAALLAVRAALLLPLFLLVFGEDPPGADAPNLAAWAWMLSLKVRLG
jgi:hypothetical protein